LVRDALRPGHSCAHSQHEARKPLLADPGAGDGSIDIYFGPKAPERKEANWVPTDPAREFEAMFRLYAPTKALFEKKPWILPDIEKVQ
jgi:hypothetical protein